MERCLLSARDMTRCALGLTLFVAACQATDTSTSVATSKLDTIDQTPLCERAVDDLYDPAYALSGGGLYRGGTNEPSGAHAAYAAARVDEIAPIDGKIGMLSIGLSNTTQMFSAYARDAHTDGQRREGLVVVNAAEGGKEILFWIANDGIDSPEEDPIRYDLVWNDVVGARLDAANLRPDQVQVVWVMVIYKLWSELPVADCLAAGHAQWWCQQDRLRDDLTRLIEEELRSRFVNLRAVYVSSREPGHWASATQSEPISFETGLGVKALVDDYVEASQNGTATGPAVMWGPYLWADGIVQRNCDVPYEIDEAWEACDFEGACQNSHPDVSGEEKLARMFSGFFANGALQAAWYNRLPGQTTRFSVLESTVDGHYDGTTGVWDASAMNASNSQTAYLSFAVPPRGASGAALIRQAMLSLRVPENGTGKDTRVERVTHLDPTEIDQGTLPVVVDAELAREWALLSRGSAITVDVTDHVVNAMTAREDLALQITGTSGTKIRRFTTVEWDGSDVDPTDVASDPPRLIIEYERP